jgi:hypothetical protein
MNRGVIAIIAFMSAISAGGSACAMSDGVARAYCTVTGGEKLAPGMTDSICTAIKAALAGGSAQAVDVKVRVDSPYSLTAAIRKDGMDLPEQNFTISDSKLTPVSIDRFAQRIADVVGGAS